MTLTTKLSLPNSTHNQHKIYINNLYNKSNISNSPIFDDLTSILSQTAITTNNLPFEVTTDHVIIGDFNIHHLSWGCKTTQANNRTPQLLKIINKFNLIQHLPPRTTTYISPLESKSTIDLVFISAGLTKKIQICNMVEALDHDLGHLSIGTILDLSLQNTAPNTRYSYD